MALNSSNPDEDAAIFAEAIGAKAPPPVGPQADVPPIDKPDDEPLKRMPAGVVAAPIIPTEQQIAFEDARTRTRATLPNQPINVGNLTGKFDAFPAEVIMTYYDDPNGPPYGLGSTTNRFVLLRRCSVRTLPNTVFRSGPSAVGAEDETQGFMAQPCFGLDVNKYYVKKGDIVIAFTNRGQQWAQHTFMRDEEPFIGKVTVLNADKTVDVERLMWSGNPDDLVTPFAGPVFEQTLYDINSDPFIYEEVLPEDQVVDALTVTPNYTPGVQSLAVGDLVKVWLRGRYMLCRAMWKAPVTPAVPQLHTSIIDATGNFPLPAGCTIDTVFNYIATGGGSNAATVGVTDWSGSAGQTTFGSFTFASVGLTAVGNVAVTIGAIGATGGDTTLTGGAVATGGQAPPQPDTSSQPTGGPLALPGGGSFWGGAGTGVGHGAPGTGGGNPGGTAVKGRVMFSWIQ